MDTSDQLSASADESITRDLAERRKAPQCDTRAIASSWLDKLDRAIVRRDAEAVLQMFAPEVKALTAYKQCRLSLDTQALPGAYCEHFQVTSTVVKQGKQKGKAYRVESTEIYGLERQSGQWLAVSATTTQR